MKQYMLGRWRDAFGTNLVEDVSSVSADLPYELQSKMFDQLAALGIAGAGLTVTLIGSVLRNAPPVVWIPVGAFGFAAMLAVTGNMKLIEGLFARRPTIVRSRIYTGLTVALIGVALGALSMSVYYDGKRHQRDATNSIARP